MKPWLLLALAIGSCKMAPPCLLQIDRSEETERCYHECRIMSHAAVNPGRAMQWCLLDECKGKLVPEGCTTYDPPPVILK